MSFLRPSGWFAFGLVAITVGSSAGCQRAAPPALPDYREPTANPVAGNAAWSELVTHAAAAEALPASLTDRATYPPIFRTRIRAVVRDGMRTVVRNMDRDVQIAWSPRDPGKPAPHLRGISVIALGLQWQLEDQLEANDPASVRTVLALSKLGWDLTGGAATEADLGFSILDRTRQMVTPRLGQFTSDQLRQLGLGLKKSMEARPEDPTWVRHEVGQVSRNTAFVLEAIQSGRTGDLAPFLVPNDGTIIRTIDRLRTEPEDLRTFLDGFGRESVNARELALALYPMSVRARNDALEAERRKSASDRTWPPDQDRLWRRVSRAFLATLAFTPRERSIVAPSTMDRAMSTLARTRILIMTCMIEALRKRGQPIPRTITAFSEPVRKDPFSGQDMIYRLSGLSYQLYSVGPDGEDNGRDVRAGVTGTDLALEGR